MSHAIVQIFVYFLISCAVVYGLYLAFGVLVVCFWCIASIFVPPARWLSKAYDRCFDFFWNPFWNTLCRWFPKLKNYE